MDCCAECNTDDCYYTESRYAGCHYSECSCADFDLYLKVVMLCNIMLTVVVVILL